MNSDDPSPSRIPSRHTLSSFDRTSFDEDYSSLQDAFLADPVPPLPSRNSWISRGDAGIRAWASSIPRGPPSDCKDIPSATLRPKLLLQPRTPVKPSLCMSRAQPAPPEPSRPIRTPQQSLPSLARDFASVPSASMVSLTTGSSSYSVVTPATGSEVGSIRDVALHAAADAQSNFFGGFRAQLRALVAPPSPQKETRRSTTLTSRDVHIAGGSDSESAAARGTFKVRRPRSPVALYYAPEMVKRKEMSAQAAKENHPATSRRTATDDHPAYRTRGRKASRVPS